MNQKTLGKIQLSLGISFLILSIISLLPLIANSELFYEPGPVPEIGVAGDGSTVSGEVAVFTGFSNAIVLLMLLTTLSIAGFMMVTGNYNMKGRDK